MEKISLHENNPGEITYDIANLNDIPELIRLRILYMIDDFGSVSDEEREGMENSFRTILRENSGKNLWHLLQEKMTDLLQQHTFTL